VTSSTARTRFADRPNSRPQAAAEGEAGHGHVARAAVQGGEAVGCCGGEHVLPQGAADDAGGARGGVDRHAGELGEAHDDRAGEVLLGEGAAAVTRALRGDAQAGRGGGAHHGDDLVDGAGEGDRGGCEVGGERPAEPVLVVAGVAGEPDAAAAEGAIECAGAHCGVRRHGGSLLLASGDARDSGRGRDGAPRSRMRGRGIRSTPRDAGEIDPP
jgi:hypothetical protein